MEALIESRLICNAEINNIICAKEINNKKNIKILFIKLNKYSKLKRMLKILNIDKSYYHIEKCTSSIKITFLKECLFYSREDNCYFSIKNIEL